MKKMFSFRIVVIANRMCKDHLVIDVKTTITICNSTTRSVVPHVTVPLSALSVVLELVTVTTDNVSVNPT